MENKRTRWQKYDLIITGYLGIYEFDHSNKVGKNQKLRERTFLLDVYGTSEKFLGDEGKENHPFCCTYMPIDHFLTMFPEFAPNNTFLGLIVPEHPICKVPVTKSEIYGLVWAKLPQQVDVELLKHVAKFINLTMTVSGGNFNGIPNVKNLGHVDQMR